MKKVNENEAMNFKESKEKYMGKIGGRRGKSNIQLYYNLKDKIK